MRTFNTKAKQQRLIELSKTMNNKELGEYFNCSHQTISRCLINLTGNKKFTRGNGQKVYTPQKDIFQRCHEVVNKLGYHSNVDFISKFGAKQFRETIVNQINNY